MTTEQTNAPVVSAPVVSAKPKAKANGKPKTIVADPYAMDTFTFTFKAPRNAGKLIIDGLGIINENILLANALTGKGRTSGAESRTDSKTGKTVEGICKELREIANANPKLAAAKAAAEKAGKEAYAKALAAVK